MNENLKTAIFEMMKAQLPCMDREAFLQYTMHTMQFIEAIEQVEICAHFWLNETAKSFGDGNNLAASGHWAEINKAFSVLPSATDVD